MLRTARRLGRRGCARSAHSQGRYISADTDVKGGKEFAGFLVPWQEADARASPESAAAALTEADVLRSMDHFLSRTSVRWWNAYGIIWSRGVDSSRYVGSEACA